MNTRHNSTSRAHFAASVEAAAQAILARKTLPAPGDCDLYFTDASLTERFDTPRPAMYVFWAPAPAEPLGVACYVCPAVPSADAEPGFACYLSVMCEAIAAAEPCLAAGGPVSPEFSAHLRKIALEICR